MTGIRTKELIVIVLSLVVFLIPNVVGFSIWYVGGGLPTVLRSLTAILGWVVAFGGSTVLFWKLVVRETVPVTGVASP